MAWSGRHAFGTKKTARHHKEMNSLLRVNSVGLCERDKLQTSGKTFQMLLFETYCLRSLFHKHFQTEYEKKVKQCLTRSEKN